MYWFVYDTLLSLVLQFDVSSGQLVLEGVPREISTIMQGLIVIVVVISYEVVRRNQVKSEQRSVARALAKQEVSA